MKSFIISEEFLKNIIKEEFDNILELKPQIQFLALKVREAYDNLVKNIELYKQKYPNKKLNLAKINEEFNKIKDFSYWFFSDDLKGSLSCYVTKREANDEDTKIDSEGLVKNQFFDILKKHIIVYYIYNNNIPRTNERNVDIKNKYRIKIYINKDTDPNSVYQYAIQEIMSYLNLMNDRDDKTLDKRTKSTQEYKKLPENIKNVIEYLWNKTNIKTASSGSYFGYNGDELPMKIVMDLQSIKNINEVEVWQNLNNYLSQNNLWDNTEQDTNIIKEKFIIESNRLFKEEFIPLLHKTMEEKQKDDEINNSLIEYFSKNKYFYKNCKYGQLKINYNNRNNKCTASVWMWTPDKKSVIKVMNNHYSIEIGTEEAHNNINDVINFVSDQMERFVIENRINNGYVPITDATWEEVYNNKVKYPR